MRLSMHHHTKILTNLVAVMSSIETLVRVRERRMFKRIVAQCGSDTDRESNKIRDARLYVLRLQAPKKWPWRKLGAHFAVSGERARQIFLTMAAKDARGILNARIMGPEESYLDEVSL